MMIKSTNEELDIDGLPHRGNDETSHNTAVMDTITMVDLFL